MISSYSTNQNSEEQKRSNMSKIACMLVILYIIGSIISVPLIMGGGFNLGNQNFIEILERVRNALQKN